MTDHGFMTSVSSPLLSHISPNLRFNLAQPLTTAPPLTWIDYIALNWREGGENEILTHLTADEASVLTRQEDVSWTELGWLANPSQGSGRVMPLLHLVFVHRRGLQRRPDWPWADRIDCRTLAVSQAEDAELTPDTLG